MWFVSRLGHRNCSLLSQLETFSADAPIVFGGIFASTLGESSESSKVEFLFSLSWLYCRNRDFEKALDYLSQARDYLSHNTSSLSSDAIQEALKLNDITS